MMQTGNMSILQKIRLSKLEEIAHSKRHSPLSALESRIYSSVPVRGFREALLRARQRGEYGLITEIKKASPSAGVLRLDFDPSVIATAYEKGGASCLSVLTDRQWFQGSSEHLQAARAAVSLPVLRKDFIYDPYQVIESRAMGADAILLIMASLERSLAQELEHAAASYGVEVIAEVHNPYEVEYALTWLDTPLIGINNRNLATFSTDLAVTERLAPLIPSDKIVIAESGLSSVADLERMKGVGVGNFLIGASLMRQTDLEKAVRALLRRDPREDKNAISSEII